MEDWDGNTFTTTEDLAFDPIGISDYALLIPNDPVQIPVMDGTGVNFDWADVNGAAFYELEIHDKYWNKYTFHTTDSQFALPPGFLQEQNLYRYKIIARREFFDQNVDNGSASPMDDDRMPTL